MNGWEGDKRWSDQFLPEIKSILGRHLIGEAPEEEDQQHNTDLMLLKMEPVRIACRVRRSGYLSYRDEFTIRSDRPSGSQTELAKLMSGWGDYFFYAHANNEGRLQVWHLVDLKVFRLWFLKQITLLPAGQVPGLLQHNKDNSSNFRVFRFDEIDCGFIKARGERIAKPRPA